MSGKAGTPDLSASMERLGVTATRNKMRYANHIELQRDMAQTAREARELAAKARKLEAENKRLRKALEPMTKGTFWINDADVRRAYKALGKEYPLSAKLAEHLA